MKRKPIVGGNWKMNSTSASAHALARCVAGGVDDAAEACEIALFPPFPYLPVVGEVIRNTPLRLGAQDAYHEESGAYTGEIGIEMLHDLGVTHVLVGHSERRHVIGEGDEIISRKLKAMLEAGLTAILCIGETLEEREDGRVEDVNLRQLDAALADVPAEQIKRLVIAYEPVWAIGTGRTATPEDAQSVHELIRRAVEGRYTVEAARSIRIQYGGSVKPDNAAELFAQQDIDGGLIGGASLNAEAFLAIVRAAAAAADADREGSNTGQVVP